MRPRVELDGAWPFRRGHRTAVDRDGHASRQLGGQTKDQVRDLAFDCDGFRLGGGLGGGEALFPGGMDSILGFFGGAAEAGVGTGELVECQVALGDFEARVGTRLKRHAGFKGFQRLGWLVLGERADAILELG